MKKALLLSLSMWMSVVLTACAVPFVSSEESTESETPTSTVSIDFSYTNGTYKDPSEITGSSDDSGNISDQMAAEYDLYDPAPGEGYSRSDLTNNWIPKEADNSKPLVVMVPNNLGSLPHYTLSKAGVLYECNVEYEMTRLMAVYDNWTGLERIGNIRSARDYFVYWAQEWDPLYVHIGNIWYADSVLSDKAVNNINGAVYDKYFYRVTNEGRDYDQSAYTTGLAVKKAADALGYTLAHSSDYHPGHFSFASKGKPTTLLDVSGHIPASYVSLAEAYPVNCPWFEYNESDGLYYRYEYERPHIDGQTNEQLSFSNIIIQNTYREYRPDGAYLIYRCHDTTSDGWFITHGTAVHVNWKKVGTYGITKYYDDNGDEIILNQGKTMICVVQAGDRVTIK